MLLIDPFSTALLGAAGVLAAALLWLRAMRRRRPLSHAPLDALRRRIEVLERDLGVLLGSTSTAGDRLVAVEQRARDILARQEQLDTSDRSRDHFRHAVALLDRGASTDELVSACGLARGEAELVASLYSADLVRKTLQ